MYVNPSKALAHADRLLKWRRGETPAPVTVEWDLSARCYLGCQSCHFAHTHTKGPWVRRDRRLPMAFESVGDLADTDLVLRGLSEMAEAGVHAVVWSGGGEPTVHPEWLQIMRQARAVGLQQGMYTAGGLLTADTASELAGLAQWVVVSLDAASADVYRSEKGVDGFDAACRGIQWIASAGGVVGVSFLLHAGNWQHVEEMIALGRRLGSRYVTLRPTIETAPDAATDPVGSEWIPEALPDLERVATYADVECDPPRFVAYHQWHGRSYQVCHGIKLHTTITPDGRVWVCPQRRGVQGSEIGDLRTQSFRDVWARHPRHWTDFAQCRVMCRLHLVNEVVEPIFRPPTHAAFI